MKTFSIFSCVDTGLLHQPHLSLNRSGDRSQLTDLNSNLNFNLNFNTNLNLKVKKLPDVTGELAGPQLRVEGKLLEVERQDLWCLLQRKSSRSFHLSRQQHPRGRDGEGVCNSDFFLLSCQVRYFNYFHCHWSVAIAIDIPKN